MPGPCASRRIRPPCQWGGRRTPQKSPPSPPPPKPPAPGDPQPPSPIPPNRAPPIGGARNFAAPPTPHLDATRPPHTPEGDLPVSPGGDTPKHRHFLLRL